MKKPSTAGTASQPGTPWKGDCPVKRLYVTTKNPGDRPIVAPQISRLIRRFMSAAGASWYFQFRLKKNEPTAIIDRIMASRPRPASSVTTRAQRVKSFRASPFGGERQPQQRQQRRQQSPLGPGHPELDAAARREVDAEEHHPDAPGETGRHLEKDAEPRNQPGQPRTPGLDPICEKLSIIARSSHAMGSWILIAATQKPIRMQNSGMAILIRIRSAVPHADRSPERRSRA